MNKEFQNKIAKKIAKSIVAAGYFGDRQTARVWDSVEYEVDKLQINGEESTMKNIWVTIEIDGTATGTLHKQYEDGYLYCSYLDDVDFELDECLVYFSGDDENHQSVEMHINNNDDVELNFENETYKGKFSHIVDQIGKKGEEQLRERIQDNPYEYDWQDQEQPDWD